MEKIIVSNSLNSTDFLRTIAKRGKSELALYVYNEHELLNYILTKNGLIIDKSYIAYSNQIYIFMAKLNIKYQDAKNIRDAINSYRDSTFGLVDFDDLNDNFKNKKKIIKEAYEKYNEFKNKFNLYDEIDLINYINDNIKNKLDTECIIFNELPLSNLVNELTNKLLNVKYMSISNYLKYDEHNEKIYKAYGKTNEINYVFNELLNKKLGDCQIVLLNNSYLTYVLEYTERYKVNYTSSIGIPISYTNAGKVLKNIIKMRNNLYDKNSFKELFNNKAFDSSFYENHFNNKRQYNDFITYAGWLRLSFEKTNIIPKDIYDNKTYVALNILAEDMNKGIPEFIKKYTKNDQYIDVLYEKLVSIKELGLDELYEVLENSCVNQKISSNDSLHITSLSGAFSSLRPYTFILGLDSSFPGNPQENYFIYDMEYKIDKYKSFNIINEKKKMLLAFMDLCNNLYLSYSYYKADELHEANPSSIIYERNIEPIDVGYTYGNISNNLMAIDNYIKNIKHERFVNNELNKDDYIDYLLNKKYSPSGFYKALLEEERESFILNSLLDSNVDGEDDPYIIIDDNYKGTLIHKLFEGFDKNKISKEDMLDRADEEFNDFMVMKPALIKSKERPSKQDFIELVGKLYDMSSNNNHILSEVYINKTNVYGLYFGGQFDRLEKTKDGKYILIDYKTGKRMKHKDNDPVTCVQGLIYAYLIENGLDYNGNYITDNGKRIKIDECQFVYPEYGKSISIKWNDKTKQKLEELIQGVVEDIKSGAALKYQRNSKSKGIYDNEILYSLISKVETL